MIILHFTLRRIKICLWNRHCPGLKAFQKLQIKILFGLLFAYDFGVDWLSGIESELTIDLKNASEYVFDILGIVDHHDGLNVAPKDEIMDEEEGVFLEGKIVVLEGLATMSDGFRCEKDIAILHDFFEIEGILIFGSLDDVLLHFLHVVGNVVLGVVVKLWKILQELLSGSLYSMLLFTAPFPFINVLLVHPLSCLFILRSLVHLTRLKRPVRLYPCAVKYKGLGQHNVVVTEFLDVRSIGRVPLGGEILRSCLVILLWTFEHWNLQDRRQYVHLEQTHYRILGKLHEVLDRVHRVHLEF